MFKARGEGGLFLRSRIKGGEIRFRDDEFCWQFLGFTPQEEEKSVKLALPWS